MLYWRCFYISEASNNNFNFLLFNYFKKNSERQQPDSFNILLLHIFFLFRACSSTGGWGATVGMATRPTPSPPPGMSSRKGRTGTGLLVNKHLYQNRFIRSVTYTLCTEVTTVSQVQLRTNEVFRMFVACSRKSSNDVRLQVARRPKSRSPG